MAKFDLEILQLDAINGFIYANLDETVYIKMPAGYEEQKKMLKLKKAFYRL